MISIFLTLMNAFATYEGKLRLIVLKIIITWRTMSSDVNEMHVIFMKTANEMSPSTNTSNDSLMNVTYVNKKFKFFLKWNYRVNALMT